MDAYIIIGNEVDLSKFDFTNSYVVGVDKGVYYASLAKIRLDMAIGDFDSFDISKLNLDGTKLKKLNCIKDETDTHAAIKELKEFEHIYLLGGIQGKRIEHFLANLILFKKYPNLIIIDDYSLIRLCNFKEVLSLSEYKYYSFFALEEVIGLTLNGFKYELQDYNLKPFDALCISNELKERNAEISYSKGKLLLIKTKEDRSIIYEK